MQDGGTATATSSPPPPGWSRPASARHLSPIHKLDRVKTPLLVMHGTNDTNAPRVEVEQIVDALKQRGVEVELVRSERGARVAGGGESDAVDGGGDAFFWEHLVGARGTASTN